MERSDRAVTYLIIAKIVRTIPTGPRHVVMWIWGYSQDTGARSGKTLQHVIAFCPLNLEILPRVGESILKLGQ